MVWRTQKGLETRSQRRRGWKGRRAVYTKEPIPYLHDRYESDGQEGCVVDEKNLLQSFGFGYHFLFALSIGDLHQRVLAKGLKPSSTHRSFAKVKEASVEDFVEIHFRVRC